MLTFRNRTYESTDKLPMALRIVVQFVVRFEVRSVLYMCVILYRRVEIFVDFVVYYLYAIDPRVPHILLN